MATESTVLKTVRDRLSRVFDVRRVVLFGSRAWGDAKSDSDYDILVLVNSDMPFVERQAFARMAVGRVGAPIDLLVFTDEEMTRAEAIPGSAIYWAAKEGRVVYGK